MYKRTLHFGDHDYVRTSYKDYYFSFHISWGLNHLPYILSISVSMAVIKDGSTNYMKALGLNQSYIYVVKIT